MKKFAAIAMVGLFCTAGANGTILTSDDFNSYADGSLVAQSAWENHSGTLNDLLVSSGQAVVQHGVPSEDAHLQWAPPVATGSIYYGIDFSVDDQGQPYAGTDFEYFAHLMPEGTFNFRGRLDVQAPGGGGDYTVGISSIGSTADATWATDLLYDTVYRAIVKYDQDANQAQLWIDALLDTDTSILGTDESDPGDVVDSFALRQSDSTGENETVRVDNLIVATTFAEVVPEPATMALLAFGGMAVLRRRR